MRPQILAPLLVLAAIASISPSASAAEVSLPLWQVGDEWTYAIALVENGQTVQTGDRHVVVTARGPHSHQGSSRETVTITTWQNMSGDPAHTYADIREASTGKLLATTSGGTTHTATSPCEDVRYPLTYPGGWTDSCDLGSGPVETTYSVAGGETVRVPAGTYEALTVDAIGNDAVRLWFAQEACGKVAEFSQTNDVQTYVNLTKVRCEPPATPTRSATASASTPAGTAPATGNASRGTDTPGALALARRRRIR